MSDLRVFDAVIGDPLAYRAWALAQPFGDIVAGDQTFHGMASVEQSIIHDVLKDAGLTPWFSAFRLSPLGQAEPNYEHDDTSMGDWTAIYYLNPDPPDGDGTVFFSPERARVDAKFNRLAVFPAAYRHARAIFENYGEGESARLVQITFGTGKLPWA